MKYLYREIVHVNAYIQCKNGNLTPLVSQEGTNSIRCTRGKLDISSWIRSDEKPIVSVYTVSLAVQTAVAIDTTNYVSWYNIYIFF